VKVFRFLILLVFVLSTCGSMSVCLADTETFKGNFISDTPGKVEINWDQAAIQGTCKLIQGRNEITGQIDKVKTDSNLLTFKGTLWNENGLSGEVSGFIDGPKASGSCYIGKTSSMFIATKE
jgi:hypothetical protein